MNICLFEADEISQPLLAHDERAVHIKKILRKNVGDTFAAGIVDGAAGIATITKIGGVGESDEGAIYFSFEPRSQGKPLFPLDMVIGFPRPIQLKRLLRDMAALGVKRVHLAGTELGEKSYLNATLSQPTEIRKMLLDGIVQAGGTHVPKNYVYPTLAECLEKLPRFAQNDDFSARNDNTIKIALDNVAPKASLVEFLRANPPRDHNVIAAIGSERGWSNNERALLEQYGFVQLGMGERVMRTETAATVSAAVILAAMGHLQ